MGGIRLNNYASPAHRGHVGVGNTAQHLIHGFRRRLENNTAIRFDHMDGASVEVQPANINPPVECVAFLFNQIAQVSTLHWRECKFITAMEAVATGNEGQDAQTTHPCLKAKFSYPIDYPGLLRHHRGLNRGVNAFGNQKFDIARGVLECRNAHYGIVVISISMQADFNRGARRPQDWQQAGGDSNAIGGESVSSATNMHMREEFSNRWVYGGFTTTEMDCLDAARQ